MKMRRVMGKDGKWHNVPDNRKNKRSSGAVAKPKKKGAAGVSKAKKGAGAVKRGLSPDEVRAVRAYAEAHGRSWKKDLARDWMNSNTNATLQHLRNTRGPRWLSRMKLANLRAAGAVAKPKKKGAGALAKKKAAGAVTGPTIMPKLRAIAAGKGGSSPKALQGSMQVLAKAQIATVGKVIELDQRMTTAESWIAGRKRLGSV